MEVVPAHFGSERVDLVATRGLEFGEPHHEPCLWHQYRAAWQISLRPSETWGFTYIWLIGNTIGSPWYSIHGGYGENNSSIRIWLDNEYMKSLGEFRSTRRSHLALVYEVAMARASRMTSSPSLSLAQWGRSIHGAPGLWGMWFYWTDGCWQMEVM